MSKLLNRPFITHDIAVIMILVYTEFHFGIPSWENRSAAPVGGVGESCYGTRLFTHAEFYRGSRANEYILYTMTAQRERFFCGLLILSIVEIDANLRRARSQLYRVAAWKEAL